MADAKEQEAKTTDKQELQSDALSHRFKSNANENEEDLQQEVSKAQDDDKTKSRTRKPSHPLDFVDDEDSEEMDFLQMYSRSPPESQASTLEDKSSTTVNVKASSGNVRKPQNGNYEIDVSFSNRAVHQKPKEKEKSLFNGLKNRINAQLDTLKDRVNELSADLKIGNSRSNSTENVVTSHNQFETVVAASSLVSATQAPILSSKPPSVEMNDVKANKSTKLEGNSNSKNVMQSESAESKDAMRPRSSSLDVGHSSEVDGATEDLEIPSFTYSASYPSASGHYLTDVCDTSSMNSGTAMDRRGSNASALADLLLSRKSSEQNQTSNNYNKPAGTSASASFTADHRTLQSSSVLMSSLRLAADSSDGNHDSNHTNANGEAERESNTNRPADVLTYASKQKSAAIQKMEWQHSSTDQREHHRSRSGILSTFQTVCSHKTAMSVLVALVAIALYFLPSFVSGILIGGFLGSGTHALYHLLFVTNQTGEQILTIPVLTVGQKIQQSMSLPSVKETSRIETVFKGWMNEVRVYEEMAHHIRHTHSVYVTLDGSTLRIQRPGQGVPKRALWSEQMHHTMFKHQRYFDLAGANVHLLPVGLVRKRWWSKKYPICIEMAPNSKRKLLAGFGQSYSSNDIAFSSSSAQFPDKTSLSAALVKGEKDANCAVSVDKKNVVIYLFARASREKEEWYQRFRMASRGTPLPVSLTQFMAALQTERDNEQRRQSLKESDEDSGLTSGSEGSKEPTVKTVGSRQTKESGLPSKDSESIEANPVVDISGGNGQAVPLQEIFVHESVEEKLIKYLTYMGRFLPHYARNKDKNSTSIDAETSANERRNLIASSDSKKDLNGCSLSDSRCDSIDPDPSVPLPPGKLAPELSHVYKLNWLNGLLGRLFYDFLTDPKWTKAVQNKIQHKISKLHVPHFIDELMVRDVHLGEEFPIVKDIVSMHVDERGLWIDVNVEYGGGFCATLETKVNLMKLKKEGRSAEYYSVQKVRGERSAVTHSSEEDSGESSSEEEVPFDVDKMDDDDGNTNDDKKSSSNQSSPTMSKKIMWWVEKVASSRYFQRATEYKYVKRAMEEVSNTPIVLTAQLHSIVGTLAVNIPPPPTDRIWFGFRPMPQVVLSAKPRVGERTVNISHVTDFIEHKIQMELQRVFVLPNMDDIYLPIMSPMMDHHEAADSHTASMNRGP